MSSSAKSMLILKTLDNEEFKVEVSLAVRSILIKNFVDEDPEVSMIPIHNVTGETMAMVIEYLKAHTEDQYHSDDLKDFDSEFLDQPYSVLFDLINAANYLVIKDLLDITCQKVADSIKNKMPEEVRHIFNIDNDFTPEEEEQVRSENAWAFDINLDKN